MSDLAQKIREAADGEGVGIPVHRLGERVSGIEREFDALRKAMGELEAAGTEHGLVAGLDAALSEAESRLGGD